MVADPDPVPVFGEVERLVGSVRLTVGSSSAIFACGAARLGLRVAFAGVVGDDALGRFMLDELASRGIDTTGLRRRPGPSDRRDRDPDQRLGPGDADGARDDRRARRRRGPARVGRAGSPPPLGGVLPPGAGSASGCRRSSPRPATAGRRRRSTRTGTRPGSWGDDVLDLLRVADVFLPNAAEARRIAGVDDVEAAALALARTGAAGRSDGGPTIAVKLGRRRRARGAGRTAPSCASRRCRSNPSTRRAPAIPSTPGSCAPGSTARRSATASSSAPCAAACRRGLPAGWTPSRRSPRRGPRWRPGRP